MNQGRIFWLKGLGIAIVVVLALVFTAPASLISEPLHNQNQIEFSGITGKLLSGNIQHIHSQGLTYQNLSWDLNLLPTLSGALGADLNLNDPSANLTVTTKISGAQQWELRDLSGQLDIEPISRAITVLARYGIGGELAFDSVALGIDEQEVTAGSGRVIWKNGIIRVNNLGFELGQINADISHTSESILLDFNGSSDLAPSGTLSVSLVGTYDLQLTINPDALPANAQWLANMGKPEAAGKVSFAMKGSFRR